MIKSSSGSVSSSESSPTAPYKRKTTTFTPQKNGCGWRATRSAHAEPGANHGLQRGRRLAWRLPLVRAGHGVLLRFAQHVRRRPAGRESWRQTTEPRSHTLRLRCCVTLTLTLSLTSIPILVNAALLFIVTNCTCGWAVFYLLAEPAVFALILMVVRLQPNAAQCCSPMLQPMRCSPSIFRRSCNSMCSEAATLAARGCNSLHARR